MPKRSLYACRSVAVTWLALLSVCAPAHAQAPPDLPPCAACLIFVLDPGDVGLVEPPLNGLELLLRIPGTGQPLLSRLDAVDLHDVQGAAETIRQAGGRVGLIVHERDVAALVPVSLASASRVVVDVTAEPRADADLAFRVKTALSELRGAVPDVPVGIAAPAELLAGLEAHDVAPYLDFIVRAGAAPMDQRVPGIEHASAIGLLEPGDGGHQSAPAGARWLLRLPADREVARRALSDASRAAPLLHDALVPGGTVDVWCGDVRQRTYLDPVSLDTIVVVRGCDRERVSILPAEVSGEHILLSSGTILVRVPPGDDVFTEGAAVAAERPLTAREVIARHQAAAARQRRSVRALVSSGVMTLTFEAPGFPAPMTITAETVVFTSPDRVEIEQRDIRVNGIAFRAGGVPKLPLLEPERVTSLPLAITLTERYRYTLERAEEVGGVRCHVVTFEPGDARETLFAGRAWIAADTYALVRVSAVQTGLRGSIVQSEQIDDFRSEGEVWLLARSEVRQTYEGAGHRTPIHRVVMMREHEVNPPDFEARRRAAYDSPSVMLRDTAAGFRYLDRDRHREDGAVPEVSGASASVRTVALGIVVDPNITRPLPFAGLSYVHFDLFGRGGQLNAFFGGTFGQLAVSLPSLGGTRWQAGGRAFAIASSYHDRAFAGGREVYAANLLQRPAYGALWAFRPLTRRLAVRAGYELNYTHFAAAESTDRAFTVPATQVAHGVRAGLEGQWRGLDGSVWWSGARRAGWRAWGEVPAGTSAAERGQDDGAVRDYQRFGMTAGRSWIRSPRLVGRVELAWMGGRELDRFSRYTFGTFDNRLRGYPAALIRYDRGGVMRASVAWAAGRVLRLDAFADTAYVRDPGFGRRHRAYSGTGLAAEVPGPGGTLVGVEWGYGFQGVNTDGTPGTHVVRISAYKMF